MVVNALAHSAPDTLIVGAGLAGLVVAYRLRQAGVAVDVVEARDRPGGRIRSIPNALGTTVTAELGGEAFDSDHAACLMLAQDLRLPIVDLWSQVPSHFEDTYWFSGKPLDATGLQAELTALLSARSQDWQAVQRFMAGHHQDSLARQLDQYSIPDYLAMMGASANLRQAVAIAYTIKYGMEAAEQSCLNMLSYFRTSRDCEDLFGNSDERFYLQGGNGQLPQALSVQLTDVLQCNTVLEAIAATAAGYRVTLRQDQSVRDRSYRRVVLTLPFSVLRHLSLNVPLPPQQRQAVESLGYNSPTKLISAYRQKPWRVCGSNGLVYTDLPMQHCWEASDGLRVASEALLVVYPGGQRGQAIAGDDLTTAGQAIQRDLCRIFPQLERSQLTPVWLRSEWLTDDFSKGAYSCYRVGQWSAFYGCEGARVGNLFFAGEHCSRRYQGYMEGAAETAERVVLDILQDLQLTVAAHHQQSRLQTQANLRKVGFTLPGLNDRL